MDQWEWVLTVRSMDQWVLTKYGPVRVLTKYGPVRVSINSEWGWVLTKYGPVQFGYI